MPSKSQMALALPFRSAKLHAVDVPLRVRIDLIQKPASVLLVEDACEAPRLVLERLNIHDLDEKDISWLGLFDFEWTGEVVDSRKVNVQDIVGTIIVLDLPAGPVETLDLDRLSILDGAAEWDIRMPSVVQARLLTGWLVKVDLEGCPDLSWHAVNVYDLGWQRAMEIRALLSVLGSGGS